MSELLSIIQKHKHADTQSKNEIGERGEFLAVNYLSGLGYRIVMTNFTVPVGRNSNGAQVTGEIDIVALDGDVLCFVEVKTRSSEEFAPVIQAIDARKQRQIIRAAKMYRRLFDLHNISHRFDAVTVLLVPDSSPKIDLIKGFWNENKFRKRRWVGDNF